MHTRVTVHDINTATKDIIKNLTVITKGDKKFYRLTEKSNFSTQQHHAIQQLAHNHDIIIKPADKGGATVIMNIQDYIFEADKQLADINYYTQIPVSIQSQNKTLIKHILYDMKLKNIITNQQFDFLAGPMDTQPRHFYLLPKIHKDPNSWTIPHRMPPGRPIVSDVNSESYRISDYVNSFLTPLACKHPSYIKNSTEFVKAIQNKIINKNTILVTSDITALYTNMKHDLTINYIQDIFKQYPDPSRPEHHLLQLLNIILKNNDFQFNDKTYLQTCGCPMGKKIGPAAANIYLIQFDHHLLHDFHIQPLLLFRYLDDIFFIWEGSIEELLQFQTFANNLIPGITLKFEYNLDSVNFLDTTIYKYFDGLNYTLHTKVYFKPTDTHQLLHQHSFHPKHTTIGILKSQLIRFKRLSSNYTNYLQSAKILFHALNSRGYTWTLMWNTLINIWFHYDTTQIITRTPNDNILPIIIPFGRIGKTLNKKYRHIIKNDPILQSHHLITAYTNHPNLQQRLIRNRIP